MKNARNCPQGLFSLVLVTLFLLPQVAAAQIPGNREAMWPAPTAADWKKPVPIVFQRTWEDAVSLAQETGKAILICINMDGEIASEHYAGIRYRQPEIAKLYDPYVCVIASTYRHTPHDHDESGQRILCPRFGSVTCGEHISIEPILFEKFMEGKRIAPRHICVELDGKETYDIYYALDTQSVFTAIKDGITNRKNQPKPQVRGDRTIIERVASPDVRDRMAVESAFRKGDKKLKRSLLLAALEQGPKAPTELLRLGLFGFDEEMNALARKALRTSETRGSTDLIAEALSVPLVANERDALLKALDRLGKKVPKAKRLAQVQRGLTTKSKDINVAAFDRAIAEGATYTPASEVDITKTLTDQNLAFDSQDPKQHLTLARAFLTRALATSAEGRDNLRIRDALFSDASAEAQAALQLGEKSWSVYAVLAVSHYYRGDKDKAYEFAETAAKLTSDAPQSRDAMIVLGLFAEKRLQQISDAIRDGIHWPKTWLTDMHTAYTVLAQHPFGDASQVVMHYDFLVWLQARGKARTVLRNGLKRFPNSWAIHNRFRERILRRFGVRRLESTYAKMLRAPDASPSLSWFAGYASLVAAEFHRRAGRPQDALKSYDHAIELYKKFIAAMNGEAKSPNHYIAMAHGGKARVFYEMKNNKAALEAILSSLATSEQSAATLDGLNISTVDTAKMLRQRLRTEKNDVLGRKLEDALRKLPPELLKLPAYEFGPPKKKTDANQ